MTFQQPISLRTGNDDTDRVLRNHNERIVELQSVPIARGNLIKDVELADGEETPIAHGLGRRAMVFVSPARNGAAVGAVTEIRDSVSFDPTRYLVLQADNFGATITVDLWVF